MSVKIIEFTEYEEKSKYDEDINSFLKNESINFEGQLKGGDYRNPSKPKYLAIENRLLKKTLLFIKKALVFYSGLSEKLIIDAKYKPKYQNSNKGIIDDIREISGYSRDNKIKNFIQEKSGHRIQPNEQLKCVIIFPKNNLENDNQESSDDLMKDFGECIDDNFDNLSCLTESAIKHFDGFYKVAIDLPTIK